MTAPNDLPAPGSTPRTRVRRIPEKAVTERAALHAVLDAARVAHVAVEDDGQPYAVPVAFARDGEQVLVHGSTGSRLFRRLADGAPACLTVTILDALVVARSAFESSMNYRSAMVLGTFRPLAGAEKAAALEVLTEHLLPGRWADARRPSRKEDAATIVLALPLAESSVKIGAGGPEDADEDLDLPVWAGVVPILTTFGPPEPAEDLAPGIPVPDYIRGWRP